MPQKWIPQQSCGLHGGCRRGAPVTSHPRALDGTKHHPQHVTPWTFDFQTAHGGSGPTGSNRVRSVEAFLRIVSLRPANPLGGDLGGSTSLTDLSPPPGCEGAGRFPEEVRFARDRGTREPREPQEPQEPGPEPGPHLVSPCHLKLIVLPVVFFVSGWGTFWGTFVALQVCCLDLPTFGFQPSPT